MADFIPVNDTVKVDIISSLFSQTVVNSFWVHVLEAITPTLLEALGLAIRNWWIAGPLPLLSNKLVGETVRATDMTYDSAPSTVNTYGPNTGGVSETTGNSGNVSIATKFGTEQRGRSYRGRIYLPGVPISAFPSGDPDSVSSTFVTNMLAAFADLAAAIEAVDAGAKHVVASRYHNKAARANGVWTPVTYYAMNTAIDSQRRRLRERGA